MKNKRRFLARHRGLSCVQLQEVQLGLMGIESGTGAPFLDCFLCLRLHICYFMLSTECLL